MAYPDELLVSISCRMSQGETQREIADDMKINESTLSRIVKVAKERGILLEHRYEVRVPEDVAVAKRIGERFGVDCHVAIDSSHGVECLAAAIFREWFASDDYGSSIVLDGGRTIGGFVSMCAGISPKRIRVVPIFSDPPSYEFSALQLTIQMASVCKGEACYLPFLCSPSANRNEKFIELESTARAAAGQAKMILLGCGPWKSGFTSLALFEHLGHSPEEILTKYPRVVGLSGYVPLDCRGRQSRGT